MTGWQECRNFKTGYVVIKQAISRVRRLKQEIEETRQEIERAEREYDLERLAQLKYGRYLYVLERLVKSMGAFDKTLEFIKNCSIEELTKELSRYGIEFEEKRNSDC